MTKAQESRERMNEYIEALAAAINSAPDWVEFVDPSGKPRVQIDYESFARLFAGVIVQRRGNHYEYEAPEAVWHAVLLDDVEIRGGFLMPNRDAEPARPPIAAEAATAPDDRCDECGRPLGLDDGEETCPECLNEREQAQAVIVEDLGE